MTLSLLLWTLNFASPVEYGSLLIKILAALKTHRKTRVFKCKCVSWEKWEDVDEVNTGDERVVPKKMLLTRNISSSILL